MFEPTGAGDMFEPGITGLFQSVLVKERKKYGRMEERPKQESLSDRSA